MGDPAYFSVEGKDGSTTYYGRTSDAKQITDNNQTYTAGPLADLKTTWVTLSTLATTTMPRVTVLRKLTTPTAQVPALMLA